MASTSYLQLYLDTDYMLPIAVGVDGNLVKYQNQQGESRLWLYFSKIAGRDVYETNSAAKANFEARQEGFYGDFWNHLEKGDNVGNDPFAYIELLEVAGLLDTLRNWCKPVLGTATPTVVLNFATTISIKPRRLFIDYLMKKGFNVRSYSIEMNDLVAEKVSYDHRSTMQLTFGDQIMILQSTGNQILLSTMTWCGNQFMQGEKPEEFEKEGDDFKKMALAKMVVEKMEQYNNLLNSSEKTAEIAFQAQFANEWLKEREGNSIRIKGFYYSNDPSQIFPSIQIDANQLDLLVQANSRETTNRITKYYRENIVNSHLHTIFFGDVFRDESFLKDSIDVTSSQNKFTFFNDNALQEAMGRYYYSYGDLVEPVEELEKRYLTMEQERERIRKYVKNAETLGSLRIAIENSSNEVSRAISIVKSRTSKIEETWADFMKVSKFDEAENVLRGMATDDALTLAQAHLYDALAKIEANMSLLTDLKQMNEVHVKEIIVNIEQGYDKLQKLQKESKDLEIRPKELRERTQHYRDVYGTYLDYQRQLVKQQLLVVKRRILSEIKEKDLTMEPLPQIEVKTVTAELNCTVTEVGGGFLGLMKKKFLNVVMQVKNGAVLPFPAVLQITDSNQVSVCRDGWYADLSSGESHFETTIPQTELPASPKRQYVVQLLLDLDDAHIHLINSLYCESKVVKL